MITRPLSFKKIVSVSKAKEKLSLLFKANQCIWKVERKKNLEFVFLRGSLKGYFSSPNIFFRPCIRLFSKTIQQYLIFHWKIVF